MAQLLRIGQEISLLSDAHRGFLASTGFTDRRIHRTFPPDHRAGIANYVVEFACDRNVV